MKEENFSKSKVFGDQGREDKAMMNFLQGNQVNRRQSSYSNYLISHEFLGMLLDYIFLNALMFDILEILKSFLRKIMILDKLL